MPASGDTATPKKVIQKAVERFRRGERATALAKELKVSRATLYIWVAADTKARLDVVKQKGLAPEKSEKLNLALENKKLKSENERLWAKVRELMLKTGEL